MAVKVLITRRCREDAMVDVLVALSRLRAQAMIQKGYITGETLFGVDDPRKLLVISTWDDLDNWQAWKESAARQESDMNLESYLLGPPTYEVFRFGAWGGRS